MDGSEDKKGGSALLEMARPASWPGHCGKCDLSTGWVAIPLVQLPSSSGALSIFDASAKPALYDIARRKKNYFSPGAAFLTRQSLPNSLSRLCWLGSPNVFNHKPVENNSSQPGP